VNKDKQLSLGGTIVLIVLTLVALKLGGFLIAGIVCGFISLVAWTFIAIKAPLVRSFARRFPLVADVLITALSYMTFPTGITAFVGAGVVCICATILISMDREVWMRERRAMGFERARNVIQAVPLAGGASPLA